MCVWLCVRVSVPAGGCGALSPSFPTAFVPFRPPALRRAKQALPGRRPRPAAARGQNGAGALP